MTVADRCGDHLVEPQVDRPRLQALYVDTLYAALRRAAVVVGSHGGCRLCCYDFNSLLTRLLNCLLHLWRDGSGWWLWHTDRELRDVIRPFQGDFRQETGCCQIIIGDGVVSLRLLEETWQICDRLRVAPLA